VGFGTLILLRLILARGKKSTQEKNIEQTTRLLVAKSEQKRLELGITKTEFLERIFSITKGKVSYWCQYVSGIRTPGLYVTVKLAKFLNYDLNKLKRHVSVGDLK